jgi:hypothetical protein
MTPIRFLSALGASLGLLLTPLPSLGESALVTGGTSASASLRLRIVVPPVVRVMENSHPQRLDAGADGALSAEQRLVVQSNMKHGFCVSLSLAVQGIEHWQLQTAPDNGLSLSPAGDGYRLCSTRPGRYTLVLQHRFGVASPGSATLPYWPVQTEIMAI